MHHEQDMRRMGGLSKYMKYTYWTFLAGWLAICGIIPFSGFWSKDEILWRTASTSVVPIGWLLWIVATIAATCTAFYMTRLMAMTFWGRYRGDDGQEAHGDDHAPGKHEHHPHVPHESPKSMWIPLVVLAILATVGGFAGISTAFTGGRHVGGKMNIVTWLEPVIWNPSTKGFGSEAEEGKWPPGTTPLLGREGPFGENAQERERLQAQVHPTTAETESNSQTGFNLAHAIEEKLHSETLTEWVFIIISLVVAGFGMFLGYLFYIKNPKLPDTWAARLGALYRASYHKYWIDEIYGWAITRRTMDLARAVFNFDAKVVDGAVNGSAWMTRVTSVVTGGTDKYFVDGMVNAIANFVVRLMSPIVRAAQTGFTQNYALVMVIGLLVAVTIYLVKAF
jgi:NADH-quinone oxidoreductase subunit L